VSRTSTASSSRRSPRPAVDVLVPDRREEVRATLERLGVRPSRAWGQSFLVDPFVADAEAALVATPPGRPVLEIGGGLGMLTRALVRRGCAPLSVIERDPRLAGFLRHVFGARVRVIEGDALGVDLPAAECVVGNLPYSAATPILLRGLAARPPRLVALLQREVAERFAAEPGTKAYGRLAIAARLYGTVERFRSVPASAFDPVPEVESRLVVHSARAGPLPVPSVAAFEATVRTLFSSRRKQLGNLLPRVAGTPGAAERLARRAGWPDDWARRRPEEIAPDDFFALARAIAAGGDGSDDGHPGPQP
jgi:16S rRNA (adenine1518-N6/adenine1519-N6)-dimethyltransferase